MPRPAPKYVKESSIAGAPVGYKWNNDVAMKLHAGRDQNIRLYHAVDDASFKAKMSLGVAIAEWNVWRFEGHLPIEDGLLRLEAAWACAIDPLYAKDLRFKLTPSVHEKADPVAGPFEIALAALGVTYARFTKGSIHIAEPVVRQATLATHLIPGKNVFSDWLSAAVRKTVETFPRNATYDTDSELYDASHETPVPREFFENGFAYSGEAATAALREFLRSLDPTRNPYLRSAEELRAEGFKGTPYTL